MPQVSINLCKHNLPIRTCEICRDGVSQRSKGTDDVLISREWLTELIRDAHRYRFVKRGNSTHVLCGIWVSSPTGGGSRFLGDLEPQKQEWVGLTEEDIKDIVGRNDSGSIGAYTRRLFKQIEDKLREKNR